MTVVMVVTRFASSSGWKILVMSVHCYSVLWSPRTHSLYRAMSLSRAETAIQYSGILEAVFEGPKSRFRVLRLATQKCEAEPFARVIEWLHHCPKFANSTSDFQESKPKKPICEFTKMDFVSFLPKAKVGETLKSKVAHNSLRNNV